ncbi:hypothetical protein [Rhodovulum strictum]|uniref:Long-subunit fatty acid transport protein n=1 Tax=Rhodovulum strictum TaxID=58314 RepID=A0A844B453_9RHOB|nr:hypothetical protein [Rhodovulum strictum]MRH21156.1 hypothetical protein [Rhodovulum strictum]
MKQVVTGFVLTAMGIGTAHAGGVERSTQSVGILFEQGTYAELSFGRFDGKVSGTSALLGPTIASGDMAPGYNTFSLGFKQALSPALDLALILDQPIGAAVDYPVGTGYPIEGTTAELDSTAITALARYRFDNNVSLIGGLRAMKTSGQANLPFVLFPNPYTLDTSSETDFGYVLGIAWERPEIAARVALTYNSAITHNFDATESSHLTGGLPVTSTFKTEIPESINLEFQTGIAADTLLFGSIRWVNWTEFTIDPDEYRNVYGNALVFYTHDVITYNLGLGRKFSDTWSGAVLLGYEETKGDRTGNLGPTDGFTSVGLAATYTAGSAKITGGVRYVDIGNATTRGLDGDFRGNSGWGFGLRVGYSF